MNVTWQPIDTAPKDRDIIVCGRYDGPCVVRWNEYTRRWRGVFQGFPAIQGQGDTWTEYHETGPVTHWMPMPNPPKDLYND